MEDTNAGGIFSKIVIAIFILAILDLVFINWWILNKSESRVTQVIENTNTTKDAGADSSLPITEQIHENDENSSAKNADLEPSPSPVSSTSKSVSETVIIQTPNREIFIPLGSGQSTNTSFADLAGLEVNIDTTKYSAIDSVTFEASIWVEGGNGRAWSQIRNVSDNNPLIESQISNPTSTPTLKTSGKIPMPSGSKTYRVQAKTEIEQYPAHVDNARLKIVLR
ncbi:MAG: hypothetical protein UU23_C0002G0019 [Candidatus Curtissbacteria bacterium GW2011_GWA1_40_9]|uniref:Uncharacterized protein n=1 Tax=Candidatus Curtissbacteria bacterium GW2011_GWA1_40_9 TaxID=1618408 RepID=A0A0G0WS44_9BACT|nr:MAG: hypothetical protein UU23_C0002G0019 [Candidatus Curtissbacteria bacterium GW2011_GWA1_40_9]